MGESEAVAGGQAGWDEWVGEWEGEWESESAERDQVDGLLWVWEV